MCQVLFVICVLSLLNRDNIFWQAIFEELESKCGSMWQPTQSEIWAEFWSGKHHQVGDVKRARDWDEILDWVLFRNLQARCCVGFHDSSEISHQLFDVFSDVTTENDDWVRGSFDFLRFFPVLLGFLIPLKKVKIKLFHEPISSLNIQAVIYPLFKCFLLLASHDLTICQTK